MSCCCRDIKGATADDCRLRYNELSSKRKNRTPLTVPSAVVVEWTKSLDNQLRHAARKAAFNWEAVSDMLYIPAVECRLRYNSISTARRRGDKKVDAEAVSSLSSGVPVLVAAETIAADFDEEEPSITPSTFGVFTHSLKKEMASIYNSVNKNLPSATDMDIEDESTTPAISSVVEETKTFEMKPAVLPIRRAGVGGSEFKTRSHEKMLLAAQENDERQAAGKQDGLCIASSMYVPR